MLLRNEKSMLNNIGVHVRMSSNGPPKAEITSVFSAKKNMSTTGLHHGQIQ